MTEGALGGYTGYKAGNLALMSFPARVCCSMTRKQEVPALVQSALLTRGRLFQRAHSIKLAIFISIKSLRILAIIIWLGLIRSLAVWNDYRGCDYVGRDY